MNTPLPDVDTVTLPRQDGRHRSSTQPRRRAPIVGTLVLLAGVLGGSLIAMIGDPAGADDTSPAAAVTTITPVPDGFRKPDALGDPWRVNIGRVVAVPDGETVVVSLPNGTATVPIVGVDAPTGAECGATQATDHARAALLERDVTLLPDITLAPEPGREARYVVTHDGQLSYTDAAIGAGVARADQRPAWYQRIYLAEQDQARAAGRGLWGRC